MSTASTTAKSSLFQRFTAVDLITLAVFAAMYRALWYGWHALNFLFPFNQVLNDFFMVLLGITAVMIVRKLGAATLFTIAGQLINLFIQGEMPVVALMFVLWGVIADLYFYFRIKSGANPFNNLRDILIAGFLMALMWSITNWGVAFPFLFLIALPISTYLIVGIATTISGFIGGWIGYSLGGKLKGLIE
jgi:hypothetical protein